jgi:5,10-methylenetetrahydromethanopterin reductase
MFLQEKRFPEAGVINMSFENIGVGIDGSTSTSETLALAKKADALGFHSFWLSEGYHSRSAIVRASVIATGTTKIHIGLGILSPHTKHPALLAMDAASLDEVARGRIILGVGMVVNALRKHGCARAGAVQVVKETLEITKKLLTGESLEYDGRHFKVSAPGTRLEIDFSRNVPVYVGATGPRMLQLAGQYADGVLFNYPCTPAFVREGMTSINAGLRASGRTLKDFTVAAYLLMSVDQNRGRAIEAAKQFIAKKLPTRHPEMLRHAGVSAEERTFVAREVEKLGVKRAADEIDDAIVRKVAIAGTPDDVLAGLKEFTGTGLTLPVAWEIVGPDRSRSLDLIAAEILPQLKRL